MKQISANAKRALALTVAPDVAKHSTYKKRTVYISPGESNDNSGYFSVSANTDINLMDSWITTDNGFHGDHYRTAQRCRDLWARMPKPLNRSSNGEGMKHARAATALQAMKFLVRRDDWEVFENAMRWNEPEGWRGSRMATPRPRNILAVQAIVKRVLEAVYGGKK